MSNGSGDKPDSASVALVFPPLVETSFGSYFPSLAVLAGHLESHGIGVRQLDLNSAFADRLLSPEHLAELGTGKTLLGESVALDGPAATAARWLGKVRGRVLTEDGRHMFGGQSAYAPVVQALAKPYLSDPDESVLRAPSSHPLARLYDDFFAGTPLEALSGVRLLGLSVPMGPQLLPALLLAREVRRRHPELRIVLGGSTISLMDDRDLGVLLEGNPSIDAAVRFDGEAPLLALVQQAVAGEWDPLAVPAVSAVRDGATTHVAPAIGPNVNELAFPRYDEQILNRLVEPSLGIVQARGCYWGRCDYCDFVEVYGISPAFRTRVAGNFLDEIETQIERHGVRAFSFITESIPPAFARRLSRGLLERGLDIRWESFAMVDRRFDRELLELMVSAGCDYLVIGLETTITRVLKHVHKSADREQTFRFLREAHEAGMRLRCNIIPDLPSTTYDEAMQALEDLTELAQYVEAYSVFPFEATRSSRVGRDPEAFGLIASDEAEGSGQAQYALNHFRNVDPAMTPSEREEVIRRFELLALATMGRREVGEPPADLVRSLDADTLAVRLDSDELDLQRDGQVLAITHMRTRERIRIPSAAARLLEPYLDGRDFSVAEMRERVGDAATERLFANLIDAQMLRRATAPAAA